MDSLSSVINPELLPTHLEDAILPMDLGNNSASGSNGSETSFSIITTLDHLAETNQAAKNKSEFISMDEVSPFSGTQPGQMGLVVYQWDLLRRMIESEPLVAKIVIGMNAKLISDLDKGIANFRFSGEDRVINVVKQILDTKLIDRNTQFLTMISNRWFEFKILLASITNADLKDVFHALKVNNVDVASKMITSLILIELLKSPFYPKGHQIFILTSKMEQKLTSYHTEYLFRLAEYNHMVDTGVVKPDGIVTRSLTYIFEQMDTCQCTTIQLFNLLCSHPAPATEETLHTVFFPNL